MRDIDDKSIDVILCDLPFGITAAKWDVAIDFTKLWAQYNRIIKDNGTISLFSYQPFTTCLINSNLKDFRYCWYWMKNQSTNFFHAKSMPLRKVEEICVFKKGKYNPLKTHDNIPTNSAKGCSSGKAYFGENKRNYGGGETDRYPSNVLNFKCVDNYSRKHSAQKPVDLLEYLIQTYSDSGDLILDNCAGVCSTAIASINQNRKWICIEKEQEFCDIGQQRIDLCR